MKSCEPCGLAVIRTLACEDRQRNPVQETINYAVRLTRNLEGEPLLLEVLVGRLQGGDLPLLVIFGNEVLNNGTGLREQLAMVGMKDQWLATDLPQLHASVWIVNGWQTAVGGDLQVRLRLGLVQLDVVDVIRQAQCLEHCAHFPGVRGTPMTPHFNRLDRHVGIGSLN